MKMIFLINVPGKHGYSFMVSGELKDIDEAIEAADINGLFEDDEDIEFAYGEEVTCDKESVNHFIEAGCLFEV